MRVLVACEFSGVVRRAFRERGHDAWSCDLLPAEDNSQFHIQGDVLEILADNWDLMIAHPPCTYLSVSGMHWTKRGLRDPKLTEDALKFVQTLLTAPIPHIALENPVSIISSRIRKPEQIIQPWQFGHPESKATCLWLKNLPHLKATSICQKPASGRWENQTPSGQNKLGPSEKRASNRSRTYNGIATAMAEQWSAHLSDSPMTAQNATAAGNLGALFTWNTTPTAPASDPTTPKTKDGSLKNTTENSTQYVLCEPDPYRLIMALSRLR